VRRCEEAFRAGVARPGGQRSEGIRRIDPLGRRALDGAREEPRARAAVRKWGPSLFFLILLGCATPSVVTRPGADLKSVHDAQVLGEVRRLGRNGDWLVIRGYHATDNMVSVATNTPWSHAAVLDKDHDQVVEAEGKGVHTTPLAEFVAKSH